MWDGAISTDGIGGADALWDRAFPSEGEQPGVILRDLASRPRPNGHVIVFANEKGGVGKSTLSFHCCVALCDAGEKVAVIDLDRQQQTLARALGNREGTARSLGVDLPRPRHAVLNHQSGAQLSQEIARIGSDCRFIVIDVAGHDSAIARRAIALADTLVTPVNSSFVDLDLLGKYDPVTMRLKEPGHFACLVNGLRQERIGHGLGPIDWVVMKNRSRAAESRQQQRIDLALEGLAQAAGFRLGHGLSERVAYRELFPFGLTHLDLKHIPRLARMQMCTGEEIHRLLGDLALPLGQPVHRQGDGRFKAKVMHKAAQAFNASLHGHMRPSALAKID